MKIAFSYPPIVNRLGQKAMVSQNRNVQFFKTPTYLLPVVHAQAATWLKQAGHKIRWDDGNSQLKTYRQWFDGLVRWKPEMIVLESTTPVMNFYWQTIDKLKSKLPKSIIVMTGYHSMRMPEETLKKSATDVVIKSNHVDFAMMKLVKEIEADKKNWRKNAGQEGLTIRIGKKKLRDTGAFRQVEPIGNSPMVDRDLVGWKSYAYENGNFLQTPGTYATSVIRDCMFGKCTFCRYNGPGMTFSKIPVEKSLDEYEMLINKYGVKEIFDDSGVWYRGSDARDFAKGIIARGLHRRGCYFGINTRFEYLDKETIKLLAKANFRFVLIGLESGSNETLSRLNKGYKKEFVKKCLRWMTRYGLHPHITVMVGYYWETQEMLDETVRFVREIMLSGLSRTLQVTLCTPLDYTPYHVECINKKVLLTNNYDDHDMSKLIVRTPIPHERYYEAIKKMYLYSFYPQVLWGHVKLMFDKRFGPGVLLAYGWRAIRRVRNHLFNLTEAYRR